MWHFICNQTPLKFLWNVCSFELCYFVETDDYNHIVEKGVKYLKCNYLEKKYERKGSIFYKMIGKIVVLPTKVVYPLVLFNDNLSMSVPD